MRKIRSGTCMSSGLIVPVNPSRLGVVIGRDGSNKRKLEEAFNVELSVDSEKAVVTIRPREGGTPYMVLKARRALEAISLGFSVDDALLLADDAYDLQVIDLSEVSRNWEDLRRIKARIIGTEGRFKKTLEEQTGVRVVVGDKYVGIIGDYEQLRVAREALMRLIRGQAHQSVLKYLERESFSLRKRRLELWEKWST
uniref:RNA-processing protein n=1 Tax=Thermofilum pendens TaxID=2269 RepID=A0A7C1T0W2_THEPE